MVLLRFVTVLILSVVLDLAAPLAPESMESPRDTEVVARVAQRRHPVRVFREVAFSPARGQAGTSVQPIDRRAGQVPVRSTTIGGRVRKTPPSASDSASVPDDH